MSAPPKVLIVEDELKIAALLADYFRQAGFDVLQLHRGGEVLPQLAADMPSLLLLDIMLPEVDGLSLCRDLRRRYERLPIMLVTARVEEIDRLLGLELGADDYICKPFSPREVVARAKAVLRRAGYSSNPESAAGHGGLRVDVEGYHAWLDDQELGLTPVEFRLLQALLQIPGRVHSRSDLMSVLYLDHRVVTDRTVDSHVKNLRRKLDQVQAGAGERIESVYGVGYRLD